MATQAEVQAAIAPHADKLADGAPQILGELWGAALMTADPSILPDVIGARLASSLYSGFLKGGGGNPQIAPPAAPQQPVEPVDPNAQLAANFRDRQARNGSMGLTHVSAPLDAIQAARQADIAAAAAAAANAPLPPGVEPGMTWKQAITSGFKHAVENNGSNWLRMR